MAVRILWELNFGISRNTEYDCLWVSISLEFVELPRGEFYFCSAFNFLQKSYPAMLRNVSLRNEMIYARMYARTVPVDKRVWNGVYNFHSKLTPDRSTQLRRDPVCLPRTYLLIV